MTERIINHAPCIPRNYSFFSFSCSFILSSLCYFLCLLPVNCQCATCWSSLRPTVTDMYIVHLLARLMLYLPLQVFPGMHCLAWFARKLFCYADLIQELVYICYWFADLTRYLALLNKRCDILYKDNPTCYVQDISDQMHCLRDNVAVAVFTSPVFLNQPPSCQERFFRCLILSACHSCAHSLVVADTSTVNQLQTIMRWLRENREMTKWEILSLSCLDPKLLNSRLRYNLSTHQ